MLRFWSLSLVGLVSCFAAPAALAQDMAALPPAVEVRTKLEQWVLTKQITSEESAAWASEKTKLGELNGLRRQEIEQLKEFAAAAGERVTELAGKREAYAEEEKNLKTWRRALETTVTELESRVRTMIPVFPLPLRDDVAEAIIRLEEGNDAAEAPLQQRARDVMMVLQAYQKHQNEITVLTEVRELGGQRREVEVLYLGLDEAWYVDASGRFSGVGQPTSEGWQWREENGLASRVRQAIDLQAQRAEPAFATLPISGKPQEQGSGVPITTPVP
jgi:Protein of unknown function (DUF3450)